MKTLASDRKARALTLIETLVVMAVLALLIAFLGPALLSPRDTRKRMNCINNLKQIGLSFRLFAVDNNGKYPMQVSVTNGGTLELVESGNAYPHFVVMSNNLVTPKLLICPEDKLRIPAPSFAPGMRNSNVSYFVGVDASENQPTMLLSGDANLAIRDAAAKPGLLVLWTNSPVAWAKPRRPWHGDGGNIVLADGSVQQVSSKELRQALQQTGVATNRLAIP